MNIHVTLKTGQVVKFEHEGRAGGSYTKRLKYEGAFVVVEDEWGRTTAFPAADVTRVETFPVRY